MTEPMRANRAYCCLPCREETRIRARRRQMGMGTDDSYGILRRKFRGAGVELPPEAFAGVGPMRQMRREEALAGRCLGCENAIGASCVHYQSEHDSYRSRHAVEGDAKPLTRDAIVGYIDELFAARKGKDLPLPDLLIFTMCSDRVGVVPDDTLRIANATSAEPWIAALAAKATLMSITSRAPDGELKELRAAESLLSLFLELNQAERTEAN